MATQVIASITSYGVASGISVGTYNPATNHLPAVVSLGASYGEVDLGITLPMLGLDAVLTPEAKCRGALRLPMRLLSVRGDVAWRMDIAAPALQLTCAFDITRYWSLAIQVPQTLLRASGTAETSASATLELGTLDVSAWGAGFGAITAPWMQVSGDAVTPYRAWSSDARTRLPKVTLSGYCGGVTYPSSWDVLLPVPQSVVGGHAYLRFPGCRSMQ